jgi:hypothetical protein
MYLGMPFSEFSISSFFVQKDASEMPKKMAATFFRTF